MPTDDRTTDVKSYLEFANDRGLLNVGYTASWFDNKLPTVHVRQPVPRRRHQRRRLEGAGADVAEQLGLQLQRQRLVQAARPQPGERVPLVRTVGAERGARRADGEYGALRDDARARSSDRRSQGRHHVDGLQLHLAAGRVPLAEREVPLLRLRQQDAALRDARPDRRLVRGHGASSRTSRRASSGTRSTSTRPSTPGSTSRSAAGYSREDDDRTFRIYEKTAEDTYRFQVGQHRAASTCSCGRSTSTRTARARSSMPTCSPRSVSSPGCGTSTSPPASATASLTTLSVMPVKYLDFSTSFGWGQDEYPETEFGLQSNDSRNWILGVDGDCRPRRSSFGAQLRRGEVHRAAVLAHREPAERDRRDLHRPDPRLVDWTRKTRSRRSARMPTS